MARENIFYKRVPPLSIEVITQFRNFSGNPAEFLPAFLSSLVNLLHANVGVLIVRNSESNSNWKTVAISPDSQKTGFYARVILDQIKEITSLCQDNKNVAAMRAEGGHVLVIKLLTGNPSDHCLVILFLQGYAESEIIELTHWLPSVIDIPETNYLRRMTTELKIKVEHLARVLDLMVLVNESPRFLATAMTLCNELASRYKCERVSIGWIDKGYIRLQAMSHIDHFDRKTEAVLRLESVMEEAFDQNSEVIVPEPNNNGVITRAHHEYAGTQNILNIYSLPLRIKGEPVAVCTCERSNLVFSEADIQLLRLSCDQISNRLADLKHNDCWFGARLLKLIREKLALIVGFEHTWAKILTIVISFILAIVCFLPIPFRLEAPVILKTDEMYYLTASFDGHIDKVFVRVGDPIIENDKILVFDQRNLLLEEAASISEKDRYQREFEKARATNALAEMRVAEALRDQAAARLDIIRYRLNRSIVYAPFNGVVVEGNLIERLGAPVKQGDILFKVAKTTNLYAELNVKEEDIYFLDSHARGEIALINRPQEIHRIHLTRVDPTAVAKDKGNVFVSRAEFDSESPEWWRPGMTGIAKVNAGKKTLLWIMTRRTIDFLRLHLWW